MSALPTLPAGPAAAPAEASDRPAAFLLTGSFLAICRAPRYLEELSRRGLKILLITPAVWRDQARAALREPGHPAAALDDIAFVEGSVDREGSFTAGVVAAVRGWESRYDIIGVYAAGETLVEPTSLIADALNLPSPGLRAGRVCRSKYLQRLHLGEFNPYALVVPPGDRSGTDLSGVPFPAVVKPATRHSSSGVQTVTDAEQLAALLATYPEHETILIEEKVQGQEFSVEALIQHGRIVWDSVTVKGTTDVHADTFVELSHTVSGAVGLERKTLLAANKCLLHLLDFQDGMTHSEWRLDAQGHPKLMEVAARTPGDGLTVLYHLATGRPIEPEIIKIALGETADYPKPVRHARQVYVEHEPGILEEVSVDWPGVSVEWAGEGDLWPEVPVGLPDDPPTLRAVFVQKEKGSYVGPLRSSEDRVANFFIDAPNSVALDELEAKVRAAVTVRTAPVGEQAG
ncbi:ATP-grasp domain-containing protein [Streptomyces antimicrobicus]|uniref:ATP-grasp domain-containing protein n=1 Tax=Streptomyces antimicrobicus TaxID=2883108 RepID=A0ABS8B7J0_9ACTN|nr:ATP-grasp domain-containing protein [Streptomyces antimicrobicus]MCB5180568.1 ATP-grasp domain-containing protein [Streptomyces antimicrobicus]